MNAFTLLFLLTLAASVGIRLWLAQRQITHVVAHRDAPPPQFADRIDVFAHRRAADYTIARTFFGVVALGVETLLLLVLTLGGGVAALHAFWQNHLAGLAGGAALILSVIALGAVIDLPLAWWRQFVIEARFGFNRMTPHLFFADLARQTALGALIGVPVIFAALWLMERMGSAWWIWVWLFWCGLNLLLLFIYPTWIAPLFNRFTPLENASLKSRIEALLARCGFAAAGFFVMDGSRRSAHGNAYFTGFGRNKRIVFFDTLLARLQANEIEAVLAHELGHFRRHHVIKRIALLFGLSFAMLAILGYVADAPWFYQGLGAGFGDEKSAALALVLFFLVAPVFSFFLTPWMSLLSRRHEFEADQFAAEHAAAADLVSALVKLYEDNAATLTPDPLHSLFYDSHPPAALRIARLSPPAAP
ncbi:M48 family metalloprotease [Rhodocyclus tenuis]|uniref:M48 family metallopeptidase n=1 Tax=Rhodocyclus gracilis TaxID=2929842 RepID=UPI001298936C|nr:M48 family metallopeptidase [Rhodocyclus gracilis]MRD72488.1 M48 family metalloprotease [Rhodocyclus gracilis]